MNVTIRYPRVSELEPGTLFSVGGQENLLMAVGRAEDGYRQVVNMKTFQIQDLQAHAIAENTYTGNLQLHVIPATLKKDEA